jgi:hypothetical protein
MTPASPSGSGGGMVAINALVLLTSRRLRALR